MTATLAPDADVRAWARDAGVPVADRGKVSAEVRAEHALRDPGARLHVGVSGSRHGLSPAQRRTVRALLHGWRRHDGARVLHHGDCLGVDDELAGLAREFGYHVVGHPPTNRSLRAWACCDELRPPRRYLQRNRDIVAESARLLACPASSTPQQRSGTWATVRYAVEAARLIIVVGPDGALVDDVAALVVQAP